MKYFTTSEYIKALKIQDDGNLYICHGKSFRLFTNKKAAEYDADWVRNYMKEKGIKGKKPIVYQVKFERVK